MTTAADHDTPCPHGHADDPAWSGWQRPGPSPARRRQDVGLALAVAAGALVMTVLVNSMGAGVGADAPHLAEQLLWSVAVPLPLVVRRSFPLAVPVVVGALFIAAQARQVGDNLVPSISLFVALYTAGAWGRDRTAARRVRVAVVVVMFCWLGYGLVRFLVRPAPPFEGAAGPLDPMLASVLYGIAFNLVFFLSAYFFGDMAWLSARRQAELEHRAEQLRRSQEQNTRGAIVAERVRIARDLHDVVAHHVSVMGVQAGAARRVLDRDPALARDALRTVEGTARTAIGELRGLLGVLRAEPADEVPDAAGGETSSPGLDQLPALASAARSAGLDVEHGVYGEPRPVPEGVALSVYRVVQESLTNVVKHAGARKADVRVRFLESSVEVEVADDGRGAAAGDRGGGLGLLGMRERVAVHGGELEAGPRRDGGYLVRARFPA
ncbi:sensor histidine kinase [Saccharothrix algeriensis]|uniref:histidine kinase n=1 Tax=Saccharothrix algeriensis TaxID=173560 RepID=A0A8T8I185_9PSEU|nr:histidine kinase [Saccharothrix algeriensis]MBM7810270.1 signal transduction histidine kinase [Saccharothrix algeriensis]QTR04427.1 sensor histidine kinase [Saccharothrix algeriensis]